MTKSDDLDLHISSPSEAGMEAVGKRTKDGVHALNAMAHHRETPGFPRRMEFMGGTALSPSTTNILKGLTLNLLIPSLLTLSLSKGEGRRARPVSQTFNSNC